MSELPTSAAFFDVDGTLTRRTTLFGFLRHDMASRGLPHQAYLAQRERLHAMTLAGAPRRATNRAYFRLLAGRSAGELAEAGRRWYAEERAADGVGFFRPEALAALAAHRAAGRLVVLVSGSFAPCLDPLAAELGADAVLCTAPRIVRGRYTGEVEHPMLDARKALAAAGFAARRGLDLTDCHAYGDHHSDLPLLRLVGHPVVVGEDEVLHRTAAEHGWPLLRPTRDTPTALSTTALPSATTTHGIGEAQ
ncbi:HAD family hydrolase [Kitasatospora sp. NBC_01302]|uniref:HAD family hydrolase n=1 Tax=Kitasatospora sp. NBC_01302 TaxID=2903575 RepID=UPI002E15702D|nr:HAD-IB family hydrolase [Kitasatospora sp. NBC_01302]